MGVQHSAKPGFRITDDWQKIIDEIFVARLNAAGTLNFISTLKRVIDALDHCWHRVDRIQRLIGVHGHVGIVISRDLPAG